MKSKRAIELLVVLFFVVLLGAMLLPVVEVSRRSTWVCPVCGARKRQVVWMLGHASDPVVEPSPLTEWLANHRIAHEHKWRDQSATFRNVFGRAFGSSSRAQAPPIWFVSAEGFRKFLESAPEAEVEEFVRVMAEGSEEEQRRAIRDSTGKRSQEGGRRVAPADTVKPRS